MAADDPDRRKFLKVSTCALGAGAGLALVIPTLRLIAAPGSATTVTGPSEPLDLGLLSRFRFGAEPMKVEVIAPIVKDAWTAAHNVVLGAAYLMKTPGSDIPTALSAVCPHLGCAIGWDGTAKNYLCPCHDSTFGIDGARKTGPAERGLDPLPVAVKEGRLQLTWVRYRAGGSSREPV